MITFTLNLFPPFKMEIAFDWLAYPQLTSKITWRLDRAKYGEPIVAILNKWIFQFKESILVQINAKIYVQYILFGSQAANQNRSPSCSQNLTVSFTTN